MLFKWTKEELIVCPIAFILLLILAIFFGIVLRNKSKNTRIIPLKCISIALIIMEIFKQTNELKTGYSFYSLPLHFCSFFIFWPLLTFSKNEKIKSFGQEITFIWSAMITISMFANPYAIYGNSIKTLLYDGIFEHTFVFHELVILYFLLNLTLRIPECKIKFLKFMPLAILLYGIVAIPSAYIFNSNYCNILECQFFNPLEIFRQNYGQLPYNLILFIVGTAFIIVSYLIACLIKNIIFKTKKQTK